MQPKSNECSHEHDEVKLNRVEIEVKVEVKAKLEIELKKGKTKLSLRDYLCIGALMILRSVLLYLFDSHRR
jgi:hypothetical protein